MLGYVVIGRHLYVFSDRIMNSWRELLGVEGSIAKKLKKHVQEIGDRCTRDMGKMLSKAREESLEIMPRCLVKLRRIAVGGYVCGGGC